MHMVSLLPPNPKHALLSTLPSTTILAHISAITRSFSHFTTLTGFKHLSNTALTLASQSYTPVFAFEEALGYMFPSVVMDKDAIAAGAVFLSAVAKWRAEGLTPWSKLEQIYREYGFFESRNTYVVSPSPAVTDECFAEIRARGEPDGRVFPEKLGAWSIARWRDLTKGWDSATEGNQPDLPVQKSSQMITMDLQGEGEKNAVRVTMRASGTEPKIKFYVEAQGGSKEEAGGRAEEVLQEVTEGWFRATERDLGKAY